MDSFSSFIKHPRDSLVFAENLVAFCSSGKALIVSLYTTSEWHYPSYLHSRLGLLLILLFRSIAPCGVMGTFNFLNLLVMEDGIKSSKITSRVVFQCSSRR